MVNLVVICFLSLALASGATDVFSRNFNTLSRQCYSATGLGNNAKEPLKGSVNAAFTRLCPFAYADGFNAMPRSDLGARTISNAVDTGSCTEIPNSHCASDMSWAFGQLIAHDLSLTPDGTNEPITVPQDMRTATDSMTAVTMQRSERVAARLPREQFSKSTAFLDLSAIYGSDSVRAGALKLGIDGLLRTTPDPVTNQEFLPANLQDSMRNPIENDVPAGFPNLHLASGDGRGSEQRAIFALTVIFIRNHNRLARNLKNAQGSSVQLSDSDLFEAARALNIASYQWIVFNEYLPSLLGSEAPSQNFTGPYDPSIDPTITNEFATAAFRMSHSLVGCNVPSFTENLQLTDNSQLADTYFNVLPVTNPAAFDAFVRGLLLHQAQEMDTIISDSLRNHLFKSTTTNGFDLNAIDLVRGRDHGLPGFVEMRNSLNLTGPANFNANLKDSINFARTENGDIDPMLGMLAEVPKGTGMLGETSVLIVRRQFENLRSGDRCYFETLFASAPDLVAEIKKTTLLSLIRKNSGINLPTISSAFFVSDQKCLGRNSAVQRTN